MMKQQALAFYIQWFSITHYAVDARIMFYAWNEAKKLQQT